MYFLARQKNRTGPVHSSPIVPTAGPALSVLSVLSILSVLVALAAWSGCRSAERNVGRIPASDHVQTLRQVPIQGLSVPGPGTFLIARRGLPDPNFSESVVLLLDYNREGAIGLIINRPTDLKLGEVLPKLTVLERRPDRLFFGGPVAKGHLSLLVRVREKLENVNRIMGDTYASGDITLLLRLIAEGNDDFRVYGGYAGWAPGQLDAEVERGDWYIVTAEERFVFYGDPERIWTELIERVDLKTVKAFGSRFSG